MQGEQSEKMGLPPLLPRPPPPQEPPSTGAFRAKPTQY
ncbi:hypothetical protein CWATWH0005_826 [Crocosphaera watsonii WH 0005]|uniref:Uncharacterized protein n=1 Tax=Crocosphaera watsonii WH 0005 TaxID=423472 RepID=T2IWM4_CROWT|nr:hypothetical protein CWATWH0005_826 [Crocosphaera watsonii WH 0005]